MAFVAWLVLFVTASMPSPLEALSSNDLYFGGKSVLRCATLGEVAQPRQVEWFHEDELIYVATIQVSVVAGNVGQKKPAFETIKRTLLVEMIVLVI